MSSITRMRVRRAAWTALAAGVLTLGSAIGAAPAWAATSVSIDAGGPGEAAFVADSYGDGRGLTDTKPAGRVALANWRTAHPVPASVMNNARYLEHSYVVTGLTPGASHEVRLYFMEYYHRFVGDRVFDVEVNDTVVLRDFDILGEVRRLGGDGGAAFGIERSVAATADPNGVITVDLVRGRADQPQLNALAVVPVG